MPRVVFRLRLAPGSPPAQTLFLTGDHRGWSSDPAGWTFSAAGELTADLPMGALTGVMGSLAALEAIRAIVPFGADPAGSLLLVDALHFRFRTLRLPKDPGCRCAG